MPGSTRRGLLNRGRVTGLPLFFYASLALLASCDSDEAILEAEKRTVLPTPVNLDRVANVTDDYCWAAAAAPTVTVTMRCG